MSVTNDMEQLVRNEVERVRELGASGDGTCWCPLCTTDVIALALTLLPPLYRRSHAHDHARGIVRSGRVADAVRSALRRVALCPKHGDLACPAAGDEAALVNYTLAIGSALVGPALERAEGGCACRECRADALAYALNRYPSKYGVARDGRHSLHPTHLGYIRQDLGLLIRQASTVVSNCPRH